MDWFKNKYWYDGANNRFSTFQLSLNLLEKRFECPTIIETGCQRQKEDLGAGMSTSIFAEYIHRNNGNLIVVDLIQRHLDVATKCVESWPNVDIQFVCSDSVAFLKEYQGKCDLLYLDSYDYPIGQMWDAYGGRVDLPNAMKIVAARSHDELIQEFGGIIVPCQEHCLNEFKAIEGALEQDSIVLIDDNDFPGGGKPGLLKPYLEEQGWTCLLDSQQTLWVKE